jgi:hypothetical protein
MPLLLCVVSASCARVRTIPIGEVIGASSAPSAHNDSLPPAWPGFSTETGQAVEGYTTRDSVFHSFKAMARLVADTLIFVQSHATGNRIDEKKEQRSVILAIPVDKVSSMSVPQPGRGRSKVALLVLLGIFVVVVAASQGANTHWGW